MAESAPSGQLFTNGLYDKLKYFSLVILPAIGALYFGLGQIWGFPEIEKVVGSIAVLDTFIGVLLKKSTDKYYESGANFDGEAIVQPDDGGTKVTLAADRTLEDIVDDPGKHSVEFQIQRVNGG